MNPKLITAVLGAIGAIATVVKVYAEEEEVKKNRKKLKIK